jgi:hypothetical protein
MNVHVALQQESGLPFAPPRSHCSTDSVIPLPQQNSMGSCWQPKRVLQLSVVQTFWSSQLRGEPLLQRPFTHELNVVQAFPSSHDVSLGTGEL